MYLLRYTIIPFPCLLHRMRKSQHPWADGTSSLYFDRVRFAYFDLRILQREGAEKDYSAEELAKVTEDVYKRQVFLDCVVIGVCIILMYAVLAIILIYMERKICAFFQKWFDSGWHSR